MTEDYISQDSDSLKKRLDFLDLNANACATLAQMAPDLEKALPKLSQRFYDHLRKWPHLQALIGDDGNMSRLTGAQISHWKRMLSGRFDEDYHRHALKIGEVHERIGLDPMWYLGGYALMLSQLVGQVLDSSSKDQAKTRIDALLRAAMLDMELALSSYISRSETEMVRSEMRVLADILDREVELSVGEISAQAERLTDSAGGLDTIAASLNQTAESVSGAIRTTSANVETVASATAQLEAASREISGRVREASALADTARDQMVRTSETVSSLDSAAHHIDDVVRLIRGISGQTRMLALNATIEAARAGELGKGFAVVANEVKALARQTEEGISGISAQAAQIGGATQRSIDMVGTASTTIQDISTIATHVAASTEQQMAATAEIMRNAQQAAGYSRDVAVSAEHVLKEAERTGETAHLVSKLSGVVSLGVTDLQSRLNSVLSRARQSGEDAGRRPVALRCGLRVQGRSADGYTVDMSRETVLVAAPLPADSAGLTGEAEIQGVGRVPVRIVAVTGLGVHAQFIGVTEAIQAQLQQILNTATNEDRHYLGIATETARRIQQAFEQGLRDRAISRDALFDNVYEPVANTNPQQHVCRHCDFTDRVLPPLTEPVLEKDPRIVFCLAVDRNGYIATHNRKYSQTQRPGEVAWNTANCRNRRIFDDRTGILAARNRKPEYIQTYARKMSDTETIMLKEYNVPLMAGGEFWGNVRMAVWPQSNA